MQYKEGYPTLVEHKIPTACIYTMNVDEKEMIEGGYRQNMELWENFLTWYYSKPLIVASQFYYDVFLGVNFFNF